jgi:tetratricopeptide (TPR) repeat protein
VNSHRTAACGRTRGSTRRRVVPVACFLLVTLSGIGAGWSQTDPAAGTAADREARQRSLFQQAVARQQPHPGKAATSRTEALEDAVRLYDEYLEGNPKSGTALNNLGRALEDLGQFDAAAESYRKAIDLKDSRRLFYMENLARTLDKNGDPGGASRVYRVLAKEQPLAEAPHALLMDRYPSDDSEELPGYLWELLDAGQAERACLGALEALTRLGTNLQKHTTELLTVVTVGLSGMMYDPAGIADTEAGRKLKDLSQQPRWGMCAKQILDLHQDAGVPDQYKCWHGSEPKPSVGVAPSEGFRTLARSIGRRYREMGEAARISDPAGAVPKVFDRASEYFRLALDLNGKSDVDPVAFTELIRLEVSRDNLKAVSNLAKAYKKPFFIEKSEAYSRNETETIYQFHKSLGEMYAVLGIWGDSSKPASAIFQLEHAREVSDALTLKQSTKSHGEPAVTSPKEYRFSPEMTDLLALSYEGAGQSAKVLPLRLEQAERYERAGDRTAARKVLAPVRAVTPPQELKPRFDKVLKAVDTAAEPKAPAVVAPPSGAIERANPSRRIREMRVPVIP